jgi:hypothetical protein
MERKDQKRQPNSVNAVEGSFTLVRAAGTKCGVCLTVRRLCGTPVESGALLMLKIPASNI